MKLQFPEYKKIFMGENEKGIKPRHGNKIMRLNWKCQMSSFFARGNVEQGENGL